MAMRQAARWPSSSSSRPAASASKMPRMQVPMSSSRAARQKVWAAMPASNISHPAAWTSVRGASPWPDRPGM